jgi:hypothetical protein
MTIKVTDKIIAPSRGTAAQAFSYARANGAKRLDFVEGVLKETERLCTPDDMPDFAIVVGRMADETGGGNGTIFVSPIFVARGNVGGLGVTDGADEGLVFDTPIKAARAMVAHMVLYATGDIARGGLKPSDDPRYNAYRQAYGTRAVATTLDALTGKWFTNPNGAINSANRGNAIFKNLPNQTDPDEGEHPVGVTIGNRPLRIAVGAGHHDTARGNPYETELNGRKANALIKELRKRGHDVYSTHPNDGLGYASTDYNGVARALVAHVNATGWKPDYHIECHSEGSTPLKCGSFILYPDNGNDVDVDLRDAGGVFAVKLKERTGIGICTILTTSPGVSSETQSGVGLQGYRLGVFANTATLNAYCTRLIWEAGAHTCPHDKAIMDRADFPQKHALATADALEEFARIRLGWTWKGDEEPEPEPGPTYTAPSLPDWFETVRDANFPQNQEFENGIRFYAAKKKVRVKKAAVQRATASTRGKESGPALTVGTPVDIVGSFKSGGTKYVLAAGSTEHKIAKGARIRMADLDETLTFTEKA